MKRTIIGLCIFLGLSATAFADLDGSDPLLCSVVNVNECVPDGTCEKVSPRDVNAPDFLRIDVRKKTVTGVAVSVDRTPNKVDSAKVVGDKLYDQGQFEGAEGVYEDGLAWSMAIETDTGEMVLTASGDEVAFVLFGNCIAL